MMRSLPARLLLSCLATVLATTSVEGQLRPLDPIDMATLDREGGTFAIGVGAFGGQRVSLAGVEGRLLEIGTFEATWSYERIAVRIGGTSFRWFEGQSVYIAPVDDTRPPDGSARTDAGDLRLQTILRLTPAEGRVTGGLRFGVRLPTTDNLEGLGRDQTDFFTTLALRIVDGPWDITIEGGGGINGTRDPKHEQIDPILFAGAARLEAGLIDPILELTGQHDPRSSEDRRGNENIGEARLGVSMGDAQQLTLAGVRGWTSVAPDYGLIVRFSTRF